MINKIMKKINKKLFLTIIIFVLLITVFCMAYRQGPMFRSNQHTKFLHGLAQAGYGYLEKDWVANTIDPLPVFTFIVFFVSKFLHEYVFYLLFIIIIVFYIFSINKIIFMLFNYKDDNLLKLSFYTVFVSFHATVIFDSLSYRLFGTRIIEWFVENGVAGQYLIGRVFQPCVFGVFLLFSIYLFYKEKYYISIIFLGIASNFHTAYLFSAAVLTISYMTYIIIYKKKILTALLIGVLSLVLVIPIIIYNFIYLGPSESDLLNKSMDIMVNFRIPHHSVPLKWINVTTFLKLGVIITGLILIRKTKLFLVLLIPFIIAVLLTVIQIFINNNIIGFIHPWRISVWLVPLSTFIIFGFLISLLKNIYYNFSLKKIKIVYGVLIFFLIINFGMGINGFVKEFKNYLNIDHGPMMNFVSKDKQGNHIYLIPIDLSEFRLNTGVPIFVTEKTHPYKDVEILEWYNRVLLTKDFYGKGNDKVELIKKLNNEYKITHILFRKKQFFNSDLLEQTYEDKKYIICKIISN